MFKGRSILSIQDFSKEEIGSVLSQAKEMKKRPPGPILKGKMMASCFFEPSTRTRLSFESAMKKLGGEVIGFSEPSMTSIRKGESLSDTMRMVGSYADVIVIRHPLEGSARAASSVTATPVINGGDGANEHPTQTFLDLFTIEECQGTLEGLNIVFVGDLKFGRTVHSLAQALKYFNARLYFVSPPSLSMPDRICASLREASVPFSCHRDISEVIAKADICYMTRIQEERFSDRAEYEELKSSFILTPEVIKDAKANLKVLHPLPRLTEISTALDSCKEAYYFTQAENGLYVRQALLNMILGGI